MPKPATDSVHGHDYYDVETGAFRVYCLSLMG